jgi:hypothetical protein
MCGPKHSGRLTLPFLEVSMCGLGPCTRVFTPVVCLWVPQALSWMFPTLTVASLKCWIPSLCFPSQRTLIRKMCLIA